MSIKDTRKCVGEFLDLGSPDKPLTATQVNNRHETVMRNG